MRVKFRLPSAPSPPLDSGFPGCVKTPRGHRHGTDTRIVIPAKSLPRIEYGAGFSPE